MKACSVQLTSAVVGGKVINLLKAKEVEQAGFWKDSVGAYEQALKTARETSEDVLVIAEILTLLGRALRRTGDFARAEAAFGEAMSVYESSGNSDSPEICLFLNEFALLKCFLFQVPDAEAMLEKAYTIQVANLPVGHVDFSTTFLHQSEIAFLKGDVIAAAELCNKSLAIRLRVCGEKSLEMAEALEVSGGYLKSIGKADLAESAFTRALLIAESLVGKDHAAVAVPLISLAEVLAGRQQFIVGDVYLERACKICVERIGEYSQPYLMALNCQALYHANQGRVEKALPLMEKCVEIGSRLYASQHAQQANILSNLAAFYNLAGREKDASAAMEKAELLMRSATKVEGLSEVASLLQTADSQAIGDDYVKALATAERARVIAIQKYGAKSIAVAQALRVLSSISALTNNWSATEDYCLQEIEILQAELPAGSPQLAVPLRIVAECRMQAGDKTSANQFLEKAATIEYKHGIKREDALAIQAELTELLKSGLAADDLTVLEKVRLLGLVHEQNQENDLATRYLDDYTVRKAKLYSPDSLTFLQDVIANIITVQVNRKNFSQAARVLEVAKLNLKAQKMTMDLGAFFVIFLAHMMIEDLPGAMNAARTVASMCKAAASSEKGADVVKMTKKLLLDNVEMLKAKESKFADELLVIADSI